MRTLVALAVVFFAFMSPAEAQGPPQSVNAELGDQSWRVAFGRAPRAVDSEASRITTHLRYVEELLRKATPRLTPERYARRTASLDALASYRRAGRFPRRTEDPYGGRRPRFIDDRGVHCAVGRLLAMSGAGRLAAAIDREHEYAYVRDLDSPALAAWAEHNGFTLRELAMIQPAYAPPPSPEEIRAGIEYAKDAFVVACARHFEPVESFRVLMRGDREGRVRFHTLTRSPFVRCMLEKLNGANRGGGAWEESPRRFRSRFRIHLRSPAAIFGERVEGVHVQTCWPSPGPIPHEVAVDVRTGRHGLRVMSRTSPANAEVDECVADVFRQQLDAFGSGRWRLRATRTIPIEPAISSGPLQQHLEQVASHHATECFPHGVDGLVAVEVLAEPGRGFVVTARGGTEDFATCTQDALAEAMTSRFARSRRLPDGTFERYFRVDAPARAEFEFEIETPEARDARNEAEQARMEQLRMEQMRVH